MSIQIKEIFLILKQPIFGALFSVFLGMVVLSSAILYISKGKIDTVPINIPTEETINNGGHKEENLITINGPLLATDKNFNINNYPEIKINKKITGGSLEFNVEPYGKLKNTQYLNSKNYFFAFRFFVGSIDNGGYYQVFRNDSGGVQNDTNRGLFGAISGFDFKDGHTWIIPLSSKVIFAQEKGQFGYKELDLLNYFNSNVGKTVSIGGFISSIKEEPNGWNLTQINSIKIKYNGDKDAITLK